MTKKRGGKKEGRERQLGEKEGGRQTWGRKNKEERGMGGETEWRVGVCVCVCGGGGGERQREKEREERGGGGGEKENAAKGGRKVCVGVRHKKGCCKRDRKNKREKRKRQGEVVERGWG